MGDLAGAIDGTPSKIQEVDGNTPFAHVSKQLQVAHDEDGFRVEVLRELLGPVAKFTPLDTTGRLEMKCCTGPKTLMKAV